MELSPRMRRSLRARAHALKPVVLVGEAGISEALVAEAERALEDHELIKVRLPAVDREARSSLAETLCRALAATEVQAIGRVRVLYRERAAAAAPQHGRGGARQVSARDRRARGTRTGKAQR